MNYILKYYYGIDNARVSYEQNDIYIRTSSDNYIMHIIYDEKLINEIANIIDSQKMECAFYKIIKTKDNKNYCENKNKKYVLIKTTNTQKKRIISNRTPVTIEKLKYKNINRSNWYFLWAKKNDILNACFENNSSKYIQDDLFEYFIGMGETAILYIQQINNTKKNEPLFVAYNRIDKEHLHDPMNIVIDRRERDIAEAIKYIYFNLDNYNTQLNILIEISVKEKLSFNMIFGRILYPTYYLDYMEKNSKLKANQLRKLLNYETFLRFIFSIFSEKEQIKNIDWL